MHYQFEMIHPFERYNGIVGRIIVPIMLSDVAREAKLLICLSEYLYHNKNEYFDLLRSTQFSGGYIRWIKFFINAVGQAAKQSTEQLVQYEHRIIEDLEHLLEIESLPKSVFSLYEYLKKSPIINSSIAAKSIGLSFNSISKAIRILQENGIVVQIGDSERNRLWSYNLLMNNLIGEN